MIAEYLSVRLYKHKHTRQPAGNDILSSAVNTYTLTCNRLNSLSRKARSLKFIITDVSAGNMVWAKYANFECDLVVKITVKVLVNCAASAIKSKSPEFSRS
jgi:hypothetical protein